MKTILDISTYNDLNAKDYDDIAKNYEGVIMRIGYTGWGKPAKNKVVDARYEQHDKALRERGVKLGIYWYGTDESPAEARQAAAKTLELAKGRSYPLGVFYDTEDTYYQNKMGKNLLTDTVLAYTDYIKEKSNHIVGVYASSSWFKNQLDFGRLKGLIIWEAHYGAKNDGNKHDTMWYDSHLHQYTSNHMINGKRFDDNIVRKKWWKDEVDPVVPDKKPEDKPKFKIGDEVIVKGQLYADSGMRKKGAVIKERITKITRYVKGAKAPYNTTGDLGWVTEAQIAKVSKPDKPSKPSKPAGTAIKKGDKVKVVNNVQYNGGRFTVWFNKYDVIEVKGDRAVIGRGKVVTTAINVINIKRV